MKRVAQCNCGQLQAICDGDPVRVSVCHCLACKRRTGSAFAHNATFRSEQVRVEGRSLSYSRTTDTDHTNTFNFCPDCGATVFFAVEIRPGTTAIPVGAFADPDFPAPTVEVYPQRKIGWCRIDLEVATAL